MGGVTARRCCHTGQSLVEFSVVVSAFVILLFAAVSAAFHSVQRAMAETAAATGIQIAASAPATCAPQPCKPDPTQADMQGAIAPTEQVLRSTMFGTRIGQPSGGVGVQCDPLGSIPQATLQVCVYPDPAAAGMVEETVRGHPAYLVPFLSQWLPWSIDVTLEMHQVGYQP